MTPLTGKIKYAYRELRENYDNRRWLRGRIRDRVIHPIHKNIYPTYNGAVDIMAEDWDTLIVLDGCRADLFKERADISIFDSYRQETSNASATMEWTSRNFTDEVFGDTVYIAANPFISKRAGDSFHEIIEVWKDSFDESEQTVLPEHVVEAAIQAHREYPDKRIIVHFMQPHYPFVPSNIKFEGWDPDGFADNSGREEIHTPWDALREGVLDLETVWGAYGDNLEYVLRHVEDLLYTVDGRCIITSDHGNGIGGRAWPIPMRVYGHPQKIRTRGLTTVPWAVVEHEPRREITEERVNATAPVDDRASERLTALGYRE